MLNRLFAVRALLDIFVLIAPFLVMVAAVAVDLALFTDPIRRIVFAPFLFLVLLLMQILVVRGIVVLLKKFF